MNILFFAANWDYRYLIFFGLEPVSQKVPEWSLGRSPGNPRKSETSSGRWVNSLRDAAPSRSVRLSPWPTRPAGLHSIDRSRRKSGGIGWSSIDRIRFEVKVSTVSSIYYSCPAGWFRPCAWINGLVRIEKVAGWMRAFMETVCFLFIDFVLRIFSGGSWVRAISRFRFGLISSTPTSKLGATTSSSPNLISLDRLRLIAMIFSFLR
jgi:hypothetical protein